MMRQAVVGQQVMVTAKSGESYDGQLEGIDSFMNVKLKKVIITSATTKLDSEEPLFCQQDECYVRGNNVKTIQFDTDLIKKYQEEQKERQAKSLQVRRQKDLQRKELHDQKNKEIRKEMRDGKAQEKVSFGGGGKFQPRGGDGAGGRGGGQGRGGR